MSTESRAEKKVESRLAAQGIEAWLPKFTDRRRWSDRWRDVVLPLFPGYLFARVSTAHARDVIRTPGVMSVLRTGDEPARLSHEFITALRTAVEESGVPAAPVPAMADLKVGDEVIVSDGPLAGARGCVREIRNGRWLVVWIEEISRGVAFAIGSARVRSITA